MDLHQLRQPNAPVEALVTKHGRENVIAELDVMCYEDLAHLALEAAVKIGAKETAHTAATIVLNSGSYPDDSRALARKTLGR